MVENKFLEANDAHDHSEWWSNQPVSNIDIKQPFTIKPAVACQDAVEIMRYLLQSSLCI